MPAARRLSRLNAQREPNLSGYELSAFSQISLAQDFPVPLRTSPDDGDFTKAPLGQRRPQRFDFLV